MKIMLKKVVDIPAKDLSVLVTFANLPIKDNLIDFINSIVDLNFYKYKDLLELSYDNKDFNVNLDVSDVFDDLIFDCYDIYYKLNDTLKAAHEKYSNIDGLNMLFEFSPIYENYLKTTKFSKAKTRQIQKLFFNELLKQEIVKENYLYCSNIKETIENL